MNRRLFLTWPNQNQKRSLAKTQRRKDFKYLFLASLRLGERFSDQKSEKFPGELLKHLFLILLVTILTACQESAVESPEAATLPVEATPASTPTPVLSASITTERYTHSTRRFSVDYPATWQPFEQPAGVIFIQPENQAGYSIFFNDVGQHYDTEALNQYLVTFVAQNFVDEEANFQAISQKHLDDGSVVAQFAAHDAYLGPAINEIRVIQVDTIIFIFLVSTSEAQWAVSAEPLQALADTFTPLDTSPIEPPPGPTAEPVWELTGPTSNRFGFVVPSDWETLYRDTSTVVVGLPDENIRFEATTFEWDGARSASESAQAYLTDNAAQYQAIEGLPATEFPLDSSTGATIDFLYTGPDELPMAGSVITAAHEERMYRIVFTAPAQYYEGALAWFNPMYQSFRFLDPEDLVEEE